MSLIITASNTSSVPLLSKKRKPYSSFNESFPFFWENEVHILRANIPSRGTDDTQKDNNNSNKGKKKEGVTEKTPPTPPTTTNYYS